MTNGQLDVTPRLRVDKWLWHARVVKTRSLAQKLVMAGNVRINREKVTSASKTVRVGDVLTIAVARSVRVLKIVAVGERRGPASQAQALYEDLSPSKDAVGQADPRRVGTDAPRADAAGDGGIREPGAGRPTKRARRELDRLRGWDD